MMMMVMMMMTIIIIIMVIIIAKAGGQRLPQLGATMLPGPGSPDLRTLCWETLKG